jgi:hypothetical protein
MTTARSAPAAATARCTKFLALGPRSKVPAMVGLSHAHAAGVYPLTEDGHRVHTTAPIARRHLEAAVAPNTGVGRYNGGSMGSPVNFQQAFDALAVEYPDRNRFDAACAFQTLHLRWAAATRTSNPPLAIVQYRLAEDCQATIGSYATGSGEGLQSMRELYAIMTKRANLEERIADTCADANEARSHLQAALDIWNEIRADPNGIGRKKDLTSLLRKLEMP